MDPNFQRLINGIYWGYNALILTCYKHFHQVIQAGRICRLASSMNDGVCSTIKKDGVTAWKT